MQELGNKSDFSSESSDSDEMEDSNDLQVPVHPVATKWNKSKPHPGYPAGHDDFEGTEGLGAYDRQVPAHFSGPGSGDDQFMNSMINNYAYENATLEGSPTGDFYMNYGAAKMGAYEVIKTHLGLQGQPAEDYLNKYFNKTFDHFDVNRTNKIEAARMSGFYRFLCSNDLLPLH